MSRISETHKVADVAKEAGVSQTTVYDWRQKLRDKKHDSDANDKKKWTNREKFHIVMETQTMSETELSAYCRKKGLYVEQVKAWENRCLTGLDLDEITKSKEYEKLLRQEKMKNRALNKEMRKKDKALAETAALLVLKKKAQQIWGDDEEE